MTDTPENLPTWQYDIARLGFKHEFLLHGLLALAALHASSGTFFQDGFLGDLARNHQSLALASYIPLLRDINEENCNAMFAFSAILGATSFAFLQNQQIETTSSQFITSVVDVFELLVGLTVIAVKDWNWLKNGSFANLLGPHPFLVDETSDCNLEARSSLDAVISCAGAVRSSSSSRSDTPEAYIAIYVSSAQLLARIFLAHPDGTVSMEKVVEWPALAATPSDIEAEEWRCHCTDHLSALWNRLAHKSTHLVSQRSGHTIGEGHRGYCGPRVAAISELATHPSNDVTLVVRHVATSKGDNQY